MSNPLRVIVTASMMATLANWQLGITIPLVVLEQSNSPAVALLTFALRGAAYAFSPLLGAVIDRFDQRAVFILAQFQQAACIALLALSPNGWVGGGLLLFSGVGAVASTITSQFVLVPKFIDPEGRDTAVAKLMAALEVARVVGLLVGGVAISWQGSTFSLVTVIGLYAAAGTVALLLPRVVTPAPQAGLFASLGVGFRWLRKPDLLWLVVTMAAVNLSIGQLEAVLVTVFDQKGLAALVVSLLLGLGLAVSAVASRLTPVLLPSWPAERRILLSQVAVLVSMGLIATPLIPLTALGYVILSFATGFNNVVSITYRQNLIPIDIAGRVNSVIRMIITGTVPLSGFLYAWASHFDGFLFWLPALLILGVAVAAWSGHSFRSAADPIAPVVK
ncbi:MFS transporter [Streptomyces sp. NPDC012510]|uniref:MFS transporter n=1 Tax=Streptomyces sp. NPDC012510 TaxID=3364838 RepID=UPI0036DFBC64